MIVSLQNQMALFFRPLIDLPDNLMSNLSTFPYTAAQCEKFLELLLNMSRGKEYSMLKKETPDLCSNTAFVFRLHSRWSRRRLSLSLV
jgi:hypothetical protein